MEDKLSQSYKENEGLRIALKKEQEVSVQSFIYIVQQFQKNLVYC